VETTRLRRSTLAAICGALLGTAVALSLLVGATRASADRASVTASSSWIDATHLPPLLRVPGERAVLRYGVYCGSGAETETEIDAPCDASGTIFVRAGEHGAFDAVPLRTDPDARGLVAEVPAAIAQAQNGFTYYAVFRKHGAEDLVLPAGGAAAPQQSVPLGQSIEVRLGRHVFGRTRAPDARVAEAAWGDSARDIGLEQGRNLTPIGGASFDVDAAGSVTLLDEAHRRLLRWRSGDRDPTATPVAVNGTIADLAIAPDGTAYILESTGGTPRSNVLKAFRSDGAQIGSGPTAEQASEVRIDANGSALVQEEPSEQWAQAGAGGKILGARSQRSSGRAARRLPDGSEVLVLRQGNEIRLALTSGNGVRRSWRVTSEDPIAEVQLVEPSGHNLVVVARVYDDDQDEFVVLVLGVKGLIRSFSLDSADWAEAAPLSRFRLVGSSLYRLGSTPERVFVDRFDLEVK
jgi:hypothetical protein